MKEVKLINSIDEITEYDVRYAHFNSPSKWIQIDLEPEGTFSVFGYISGDQPTSITTGQYVKEWKTFKGVLNYLRKCSKDGRWGIGRFKD